jgi:hypothetical protein
MFSEVWLFLQKWDNASIIVSAEGGLLCWEKSCARVFAAHKKNSVICVRCIAEPVPNIEFLCYEAFGFAAVPAEVDNQAHFETGGP